MRNTIWSLLVTLVTLCWFATVVHCVKENPSNVRQASFLENNSFKTSPGIEKLFHSTSNSKKDDYQLESLTEELSCAQGYYNPLLSELLHEIVSSSIFRNYQVDLRTPCEYDFGLENLGESHVGLPDDIKYSEMYVDGPRRRFKSIMSCENTCIRASCEVEGEEEETLCGINSQSDSQGKSKQRVDLLNDPEAYTGYQGPEANAVWSTVYAYACTGNQDVIGNKNIVFQSVADSIRTYCDKKSLIYKLISGLQTSISTHLCMRWYYVEKSQWGSNLQCYLDRVGNHKDRIDNIVYLTNFVYVALRESTTIITNLIRSKEGQKYSESHRTMKLKMKKLVKALSRCKPLLDEDEVKKTAQTLRPYIRDICGVISRIFNCVSCSRCRLWGGLQIHGLRVAIEMIGHNSGSMNASDVTENDLIALINFANNLYSSTEFMYYFQKTAKRIGKDNPSTALGISKGRLIVSMSLGILAITAIIVLRESFSNKKRQSKPFSPSNRAMKRFTAMESRRKLLKKSKLTAK